MENTFLPSLVKILQRDLTNLHNELQKYENEAQIWAIAAGISNSAGNLTLHLLGNLNHFIGANLGNTGYQRQREQEFTLKNISLAQISAQIEETQQMLSKVLTEIAPEKLLEIYPYRLADREWTTTEFLLHLVSHFNYHLGQINYHRRMI